MIMDISFDNLRQAEGILDNLNEIKEKVEQRINLGQDLHPMQG